jgi:hypothetical protein
MDMKRILQAMDGIATPKHVEGASDMKKFVSIISEGTRSPSVAEQMVTTQYSKPVTKPLVEKVVPKQVSPLRGYYNLVESEEKAVTQEKQTQISERARLIAERVLMKEKAPPGAKAERMVKHIKKGYAKDGTLTDKEKSIAFATAWKAHNAGKVEENEIPGHSMGFTGGVGPGVQSNEPTEGYQDFNKVEPYAVCLAGEPVKKFDYYEDARRFHDNWKKKLYREGDKTKADKITLMPLNPDERGMAEDEGDAEGVPHLTPELAKDILQQMKDEGPHAIIKSMEWGDGAAHEIIELVAHALASIANNHNMAEDSDPCWKNYKMVGTKKKGSKTVPNCVPKK